MESNVDISPPCVVLDTNNGMVQLSLGGAAIGLLVRRDEFAVGTLLSAGQAATLAEALTAASASAGKREPSA